MPAAREIIQIAEGYLGIKESPPDSNHVIFNTRFYGREVCGSGYPWCCVFQWCLFQEAGAPELFYGGGKTASCTTLYQWYKRRGQTVPVERAQAGDLIFFTFHARDKAQGIKNHIGLCVKNETGFITTIDGNTGAGSEADGGAVMRRRRSWAYVTGAARPKYTAEQEECNMTREEVERLVDARIQAAAPAVYTNLEEIPPWARQTVRLAVERGVLKGDQSGKLRLTESNLVNLQMLRNAKVF